MVDLEQKVYTAMKKAGKPVRPADVAKMTGLESKDVSKAIKGLKEKGKVSSPKRCFWAPTK
jgi:biotin operon repressor